MNKRFFTLMVAVLLAGAPLTNQAFAAENPIAVADVNANLELANGVKFVLQKGDNYVGKAVVKNTAANATYATSSADVSDLKNAAVFEVTNYAKNALGVTFQLTVDGLPFALADNGGSLQEGTPKTEIFTIYSATPASGTKYLMQGLTLKYQSTTGFGDFTSCAVKTISLDYNSDNLKEFNSSSTTFSFDAESLEGNVFQSVTPFTFADNALANGSAEGTYFVSGAAADIKKLKDATDADGCAAALKKLNVVYVKNELWGLNTKGTGEGYKVVTISGAEFYKEAPAKAAYFDNAAFKSIVEGDQLNNEGDIVLTIKPYVGSNDGINVSVTVAAVKASASDTKAYVTTVANAAGETYTNGSQFKTIINPTLGGNTYFAASEFLNKTGASVYNVYFTSGAQSIEKEEQHEYHKYLTVASDGANFKLHATAKADANLSSPLAQWIATKFDGRYTLTLVSREGDKTLEMKLAATDKAGEYKISSVSGGATIDNIETSDDDGNTINNLAGMSIKLIPTTVTKTDGYLNLTKEEMKAGIRLSFTGKDAKIGAPVYYLAKGTNELVPSLKDKGIVLDVAKADDLFSTKDYAYIDANGKVTVKADGDTLVVPNYNLSLVIDDVKNTVKDIFQLDATAATSGRYFFKQAMNGEYVMSQFGSTPAVGDAQAANSLAVSIDNGDFGASTYLNAPVDGNFAYVNVGVRDLTDYSTLEAVSRHATFETNALGGVSFRDKDGILEGILSAEPMTFWLDTADSEKNTPSFYISKGIATVEETKAFDGGVRNFLYMPADSAEIFDEETAQTTIDWNYVLEGTEYYALPNLKAIFRPANLVAEDTLTTVVAGKEVEVTGDDIKAFQYGICLVADTEDQYYVYSKATGDALYSLNGKLGFTSDWTEALIFTLGEGDATANEAIAAESGVQVIGGQGVVTVQGAAGKVITVANILGQTIANQVAASDNVTIAVPAGIAVVSVDGEATKVVVK